MKISKIKFITKIKSISSYLVYYSTVSIGLIYISRLFWVRFIRVRTIRNIPDCLLTEYRFWFLLYISLIYLWVVKNLIKPGKAIPGMNEITKFFQTPLISLDRAIKFNKFIKPYYYKFFVEFNRKYPIVNFNVVVLLTVSMQIIPRIILVSFLLLDTFYLQKLEIFYKVVLLGLLPLLFRYGKHSLKDLYAYWLEELEAKYEKVHIWEVGYRYDEKRVGNTEAVFHNEHASIREYLEIKYENYLEFLFDKVTYEYEGTPFCHDKIYNEYSVLRRKENTDPLLEKYYYSKGGVTGEDILKLDELFHELFPLVFKLKIVLVVVDAVSEKLYIKIPKIVIFSLYFICWSHILFISYKLYPVELTMGKYFLDNICIYLCLEDNPFSPIYWGSININLITKESLTYLFKLVIKLISKSVFG